MKNTKTDIRHSGHRTEKVRRGSFRRAHHGSSLVEILVAMMVMALVAGLAVAMVAFMVNGFVSSNQSLDSTAFDSAFITKVNQAIRNSGIVYTVKQSSFRENNLTAGWDYLGLMNDVHIPAGASVTGKEIEHADALVHITCCGTAPPAVIPNDCNLLEPAVTGDTDGNYYLQQIIGHAYTDFTGNVHEYSLVFSPTSSTNTLTQTLAFSFQSNVTPASGGAAFTEKQLSTLLEAVNAVQVIYRGSASDPAVAIAYRSDYLTQAADGATVDQSGATVLILCDFSASMTDQFAGGTKIEYTRKYLKNLVTDLSKNDKIDIGIIPYSVCGEYVGNLISGETPVSGIVNGLANKDALVDTFDCYTPYGVSNVGDSLRMARQRIEEYNAAKAAAGEEPAKQIFVVLVTDGPANMWSRSGKYTTEERIYRFADDVEAVCVDTANVGEYELFSGDISDVHDIQQLVYDDGAGGSRAYANYSADKIVSKFCSSSSDTIVKGYVLGLYGTKLANESTADYNTRCSGILTDMTAIVNGFGTDAEGSQRCTKYEIKGIKDYSEAISQIAAEINQIVWTYEGPGA